MYVLLGRVIDGNGGAPLENGAVVVEDRKILQVCDQRALTVPADAQVIRIPDATIMPGLIDLHVHLGMSVLGTDCANPYDLTCRMLPGLKSCLMQGFTTIRDCGGIGAYIRQAQEEGFIESPRINSAGSPITQTGGHADSMKFMYSRGVPKNSAGLAYIADGADEVRYYTRLTLSQGADFVKIFTSSGVAGKNKNLNRQEYTDAEVRAAVEEAEHFGTYVASHCVSNSGIRLAVRCGVRTIEHASFLCDETARMIADAGAFMIPTFAVAWKALDHIDKLPPLQQEKFRLGNEAHCRTFAYALKHGLKIGYGTDFQPGEEHGREFACLSKLGMTPMETIVAATSTAAEVLCRRDIGTLEAGKLADIIVVKGNPLKDIMLMTDAANVVFVMQEGNIRKHTA